MAVFTPDNMPKFNEGDLTGTVRKLYSFTRELQDQLAFVLMSLDGDNVEGYEEIFNRLQDSEGNISLLNQTAGEISAMVSRNNEKIASIEVTAEGISSRVTDVETGQSTLEQRADGFDASIVSIEGDVTTINTTIGGIQSTVASHDGSISSLQQTAGSLTTRVGNAEGSITNLTQTANGLSTTVSDLSGKYTSLKQTVDGFDFTGLVTFTDLNNELADYPTESDLRRGRTTISGDCITTGLVSLDYLDISNGYGSLTIESGSNGVNGTKGACLTGPDSNIYFIVTNAACRMTADDNSFYVSATRVHSDTEIDFGSDARLKNTVEYDLAGQYGYFYRRLRPCRFKYNNGTSDRFHTGFIAQEVEQAITDSGLDNKDLAALIRDEDGMYALRYSELIAVNTAMIQKLMEENDNLKAEIAALKEGKESGI